MNAAIPTVCSGFSGWPRSVPHLFRLDIDEAVLIGLNEARDRLVVKLWRPGLPLETIER